MHVNTLAWAMRQALAADEQVVLTQMALHAAEANTGTIHRNGLVAVAAHCLLPLQRVKRAVVQLCELGLLVPLCDGRYDLQVGRLAA